jgi:hypothetical protein
MNKYVLYINGSFELRANDIRKGVIDDFRKYVKMHNRDYLILYDNNIAEGTFRIKYKDITFKTYDEFMDHLDDTCGGHDGTFGYYRKAAI